MSLIPTCSAAAVTLALFFVTAPPSHAAKRGELSSLAGNYEGALVISGKSLSGEAVGTGKVQVKVSTTGKKATIKLNALIASANGSKVPIKNEIKLTAGNRVKIENAAPGVSTDFKIKGRYKVRNGRVIMKFSFKDGGNKGKIKSTIRVRTGVDSRNLQFDYNVSVPANKVEYDYAFEGAAK